MKRILSILFALVLVLSFSLIPAASVGASPGPGIVGLWHLDGNANDSSGNNNHGAVVGATYVAGKFGQALEFDVTGDHVVVNDDDTLSVGTALTVEAWIKPTTAGLTGDPNIAGKWNDHVREYAIKLVGGKIRFQAYNGSNTYARSSTTLSADTWYHVAGVWDGLDMQVFINGSADGSSTSFSGPIPNTASRFTIGAQYWPSLGGWGWRFDGTIDEVRIWDQALTAAQIQASYDLRNGTQIKEKDLGTDGHPDVIFTSAFYDLDDGNTITLTVLPVVSSVIITGVTMHRATPGRTNGSIGNVTILSNYSVDVDVHKGTPAPKTLHLWLWLNTGDHVGVNAQFRR